MSLIPLLSHHRARAASGVPYNAISDCHARGMHSIVLHDEPGNRVRMFFADWEHALGNNRNGKFSIAIHPHHCTIRLVGLFGPAHNDVYALTPHAAGPFHQMAYKSAIGTGEGSLTPTGKMAFVHRIRTEALSTNPALAAHELHTIYVEAQRRAAWLVIEGQEDPGYESVCWTNNPSSDFSGIYSPMSCADVAETLNEVIRQIERPSS